MRKIGTLYTEHYIGFCVNCKSVMESKDSDLVIRYKGKRQDHVMINCQCPECRCSNVNFFSTLSQTGKNILERMVKHL